MVKNVLEKTHWWIERSFQISFLLLGFLNYIVYSFGTKIMSVLVLTSTVCAACCLLYRLINFKYFVKNACFWLSVAFISSYIISLILNLKYGYMSSIKTLAWLGMQLTLLFTTDSRKSSAQFKKEFNIIAYIFLLATFIAAVTSLYYLYIGYNKSWVIDLGGVWRLLQAGFAWNRLCGVYTDPNYGSVMSIVSIVISIYMIRTVKHIVPRLIFTINIVAQFLYTVFSDSRTGLVCACISIAIYTYLILINKPLKMKLVVKNVVCISLSFVVIFSLVFATNITRNSYNSLVSWISEQSATPDNSETTTPSTDTVSDSQVSGITSNNETSDTESAPQEQIPEQLQKPTPPPSTVGRGENDMNNDISNRRFDLWGSAIETLKLKPIFGLSFNNIVPAVTELLPETYLINNDHGKFDNYHNVFFNILVGQGLVGALIFIAMALTAFIKSINKLRLTSKDGKNYEFYTFAFSIVVMLLLSAAFLSDIIYVISANAFIFWSLTGFLCSKPNNQEDN